MRLYLAGGMTGFPHFNFPLFEQAAKDLRQAGFEVANPAEHDLQTTPAIAYEPGYLTGDVGKTRLFDSRVAFMWDFKQIIDAHAIALLPGWEHSVGARMERAVAEKTGKLVMLCRLKAERWTMTPDLEQIRMRCEVILSEVKP